jgi:hypothetical protein
VPVVDYRAAVVVNGLKTRFRGGEVRTREGQCVGAGNAKGTMVWRGGQGRASSRYSVLGIQCSVRRTLDFDKTKSNVRRGGRGGSVPQGPWGELPEASGVRLGSTRSFDCGWSLR